MLGSIRSNTCYRLLRLFIDVAAGLAILVKVFQVSEITPRTPILSLLIMAGSIFAVLAGRMFAHLVVDIADTLQWHSRRMAQHDASATHHHLGSNAQAR